MLAFIVAGISLLTLSALENRVSNSMKAEAHEDLEADKLKVKSALKSNADCSAIDVTSACTAGATLSVNDKLGGVLFAANGSTRIGKWNARIECRAKSTPAWYVMVARQGPGQTFLKDPLTQKTQSWAEFLPMSAICQEEASTGYVRQSSAPCYGYEHGTTMIPSKISQLVGCNGCKYTYKYCSDNQREFPTCPKDYQAFYRYIDRYGWAGMDFTKYTLCRKL